MAVKSVDLKEMAAKNNGEYVFGSAETGSRACYMVYGMLKPGEKDREIKPGKGHEELLLAAAGNLMVSGDYNGMIEEGSVIHLRGDQTCYLENNGDGEAVYIISGGHSGRGHRH
jgi:hypothetical protein